MYVDDCYKNKSISKELLDQISISLSLTEPSIYNEFNFSSKTDFKYTPETKGLTIQGKIVNSKGKNAIANERVYCSLLGKNPQFHTTVTNNYGRFTILLNCISGLKDMYVGIAPSSEVESEIIIENGFSSELPIWTPTQLLIDSSCRDLITSMFLNYQVSNTYELISKERINIIEDERPIFGDNLKRILLSDYIQLASTPEIINEIVPFLRVRKKDGDYRFVVLDDRLNIKYDDPLLLVDQVPYYNINKLMELQPTEIEKIDVACHKYMYGNYQFNGIVSIFTNTGNFAGLPLSNNGVFVEYKGLDDEFEFIEFSSDSNNIGKPYYANTAYWETINCVDEIEEIYFKFPSSKGIYNFIITTLGNEKAIIEQGKFNIRD